MCFLRKGYNVGFVRLPVMVFDHGLVLVNIVHGPQGSQMITNGDRNASRTKEKAEFVDDWRSGSCAGQLSLFQYMEDADHWSPAGTARFHASRQMNSAGASTWS